MTLGWTIRVWLTSGVHRLSASWRTGNSSSRCPVAVSGELHPATVQPAPSPPAQTESPWVAHMALEVDGTGESHWSNVWKCFRVWCLPVALWMGLVMGQHRPELWTSPSASRAAGDGQLFQKITDCAPCRRKKRERGAIEHLTFRWALNHANHFIFCS